MNDMQVDKNVTILETACHFFSVNIVFRFTHSLNGERNNESKGRELAFMRHTSGGYVAYHTERGYDNVPKQNPLLLATKIYPVWRINSSMAPHFKTLLFKE